MLYALEQLSKRRLAAALNYFTLQRVIALSFLMPKGTYLQATWVYYVKTEHAMTTTLSTFGEMEWTQGDALFESRWPTEQADSKLFPQATASESKWGELSADGHAKSESPVPLEIQKHLVTSKATGNTSQRP
jgi:hypothetical protein